MKKMDDEVEIMAKEKISICFIILHYMNAELTQSCVDSILGLQDSGNVKIIIVDNASPNGSGKHLETQYSNESRVVVILSDENLGFSKGNNLGYDYARARYEFDFVIAANNDVVFCQNDFIKRLYAAQEKHSFYVAGPDIYVPHRKWHQSPISTTLETPEMVKERIEKKNLLTSQYRKRISVAGIKLYLRESAAENIICKIIVAIFRVNHKCITKWQREAENPVLQGACVIFSNLFCENSDVLFEPYTFMYWEEEFLTLKCYINDWKTMYFPDMRVWHLSQGSTVYNNISYRKLCDGAIKNNENVNFACEKYIQVYLEKMREKND